MKQHKIAAYLRVSTDKQVQVFEGSLDTQKYRMQEYVKAKNKDVKNWGEIVEFYVEEGFSAGTDKRPQYQRMMKDIRNGKVNLILVADISRLSRNSTDFGNLLKELDTHDAKYLSMKEQFDTTTASGRLMMNLVVNMAQFEREQVSERVSINCNSRAIRGFVNGGRTPLGFDRCKDRTASYTINDSEAQQVKIIFNVFREQGSVGKTIPIIEAMNIRPKVPSSQKDKRNSSGWRYDQLKALLQNPVYIGMNEVNKLAKNEDQESLKPWERYQLVKASWPSIINEKVFYDVQDILEDNFKLERRRIDNSERRIYLLSGILHCGDCGKSLCGHSAHGKKNSHRYYAHNNKRTRNSKCSVKRIPADKIEQAVINHLTDVMDQVGYFNQLEKRIAETICDTPKQIKNEILNLNKALQEVEKEINSTFKLQLQIVSGTEAATLATEHLEKLGKQKRILISRVQELESFDHQQQEPKEIRDEISSKVKEFQKGFKKSPPALRRRLIHKVFGKLVLTPKGIETYFNVHDENQMVQPEEIDANDRINEFWTKKIPRSNLNGSGELLSLSFTNLRIERNGWGGWTRTSE